MKFRKIVSAISALAMSVSLFGAFATVGEAATTLYEATYDTAVVDWKTAGSSSIAWMEDGYVKHTGSGSGNRGARAVATTKLAEGIGKVSFDFNISDNYGQSGRAESQIALGSGSESLGNSKIDTNNSIFSMTTPTYSGTRHDGTYYINGDTTNTVTISYGTWYTITATVDMTEKTAAVVVAPRDGGDAIYNATNSFTASSVGSIYSLWPRSGPAVYYDNFKIEQLAIPAFNLSSEDATVMVGETTAVNVTDLTGTITSVLSADDTIATATQENGVITISGVSKGVTTVTVTAENDGLTTTKDITVISGEVEKVNVVVNYYIKDSENVAVPTLTSKTEEFSVGEVIEESYITKDDVRTDTDKYVYDSVSIDGFPYTIVSGGDNVINVYYTQVPKYTVNVIPSFDTTMVLDSDTIISGDSMSYAYPRYITVGENLYKCNVEACRASATITSADSIVVDYVLEDTGKYTFYEIDGGYTTRTSPSNGSAGSADKSFDVPEDGVYTIIVNGYGGSSKRTIDIYKNSTSGEFIANLSDADQIDNIGSNGYDLSIYAPGTTITENNVALTANDKIWIEGSASTAYIDYVLLKKIGEGGTLTIEGEENANVTNITEGFVAQGTYTSTISQKLGYKITKVTVDGVEQTPAEDGTYTIEVTVDTDGAAVVIETEAIENTWVFKPLPLNSWLNSTIKFSYGKKLDDGTVENTSTTEGMILENFLTEIAEVEDVATFVGEGNVVFAITILEDLADSDGNALGIADVILVPAQETLSLFSGEFEADAEIDESEYLELDDDMSFDIE